MNLKIIIFDSGDWGSEIWTSLDFEWSLGCKWDLKSVSPSI